MEKDFYQKKLCDLRSRAFEIANSGKHGQYPLDETFNNVVKEGFSDNGTEWIALDGTVFRMAKFAVGERVRFINDNSPRNNYIVSEILYPEDRVSAKGVNYPGWSIKGYINDTDEIVYVLPDAWAGITFAAKESEIESYKK